MIPLITVSGQTKEERKVVMAVEQLKSAMISGQQQALDAIASEKLIYVHSGGKIQNKTEFIGSFTSGSSDFVSITLTDQTITLSGKTAVVTHKLSADTADGGKPGTANIGIMLTFIKDHGDWKLLARQAYR